MERTEDQIISKAPIVIRLGSIDYNVQVLNINAQRIWRQNLAAELVPIVEAFKQTASPDSTMLGLSSALLQFPEKIADMVFSYAPDLPKETILNEASEEQLATAFSSIMRVAFPFLGQLGILTQLVREANQ